jgi:hypothetical protein
VSIDADSGVSAQDRQIVENAMTIAQNFFRDRLGLEMSGQVSVTMASRACTFGEQVNGNHMDLCTVDQSWTVVGTLQRTKIVAHESFHILQNQNRWSGIGQWWQTEGTAEYVGYAVVVANGMVSYDAVKNCQIDNYNSVPSIPPLEQLNSGINGSYLVGWNAWDYLLGSVDNVSRLKPMLTGSVFEAAFGRPVTQFYSDFAAYRQTLPRRNSGACSQVHQ